MTLCSVCPDDEHIVDREKNRLTIKSSPKGLNKISPRSRQLNQAHSNQDPGSPRNKARAKLESNFKIEEKRISTEPA